MAISAHVRLIAGLGNPGSDYAETRHNAGFRFLHCVAESKGGVFVKASQFFGELCSVSLGGQLVRLLRPSTFVNRSGRSVAALARYFKIPTEGILIVHDELDLPPGDARIKFAGGHGGHNGLRDIISHLGSKDFWRIRLGIGHPGQQSQVSNYVLKRPPRDERILVDEAVLAVVHTLPWIVDGAVQQAMNQVHARRPKPQPETE